LQHAVTAHERTEEPVLRIVCLPAVQALRAEPAVIDPIDASAADPNDLPVMNADVERATV
jgi:hypothetical protein